MRRVDAHFATLAFTNEVSLLDSQISITTLGPCSSWHSQRCFSAVGMSKKYPLTRMEEVFIHLCSKRTIMCLYGVTGCSGQVDQMLRSDLPVTQCLSGDRTLDSVRSALTGHVRSRFSLSRTLLESTGRWHPASSHSPLSVRSHQTTSL